MAAADGGPSSSTGLRRHLPADFTDYPATHVALKALQSPRRRMIMDAIHRAGEARSVSEMQREMDVPSNATIGGPCSVLVEAGVLFVTDTLVGRGSPQRFYASTVESNPFVMRYLDEIRPAGYEISWCTPPLSEHGVDTSSGIDPGRPDEMEHRR